MPYLKGTTGIQKLLIVLFVATIALSCVSLVWMMVEKPDKVTTHCEHQGGFNMKPVVLNLSNISNSNDLSLIPNCVTTYNPPMSTGLALMINISTVCAGFFIAVAAIAYTTRKKDEPDEPEDKTPQQ
jgi:hypothetical protein